MKIGIVNDLPIAVAALQRALATKPEYRVVWVASDGAQAVARCAEETPDLVLMDLLMPVMDGVEATRRIMAATPCAILIVTVNVGANVGKVFEAMGYGALDAIDTPSLGAGELAVSAAPLLRKIATLGKLIRHRGPSLLNIEAAPGGEPTSSHASLLAIGASAGGPAALAVVLAGLPKDFPAAVVIVQHVDEQFAGGMAEWLCGYSAMPVRLAKEGERPVPGVVLLAGSNDHLVLNESARLGYSPEPIDYVYRPSVDVFFDSVVRHWSGAVVAVLLTGMGRDGAQGLKALRGKGHFTIAQDQASSLVYGMPKAAAAINAAVTILPLERIAPSVIDAVIGKH